MPDGEQEYVWTVRNTGSVACEGTRRLGWHVGYVNVGSMPCVRHGVTVAFIP